MVGPLAVLDYGLGKIVYDLSAESIVKAVTNRSFAEE